MTDGEPSLADIYVRLGKLEALAITNGERIGKIEGRLAIIIGMVGALASVATAVFISLLGRLFA